MKTKQYAVDTHNRKIKRLRKIFNVLSEYCNGNENPFASQTLLRKAREEQDIGVRRMSFTHEHEQKLLEVLDDLYPFAEQPALEEEMIDLHTNKTFNVRDYIVTREGNGNFLVTPYYAEAGGTVLDWIRPAQEEGEEQKLTVKVCKQRSTILQ